MNSRSLMMKIESEQDAAKISSTLLKGLGELSSERVHMAPMLATPNSKKRKSYLDNQLEKHRYQK